MSPNRFYSSASLETITNVEEGFEKSMKYIHPLNSSVQNFKEMKNYFEDENKNSKKNNRIF